MMYRYDLRSRNAVDEGAENRAHLEARYGADVADLLELRQAVKSGQYARAAELRASGRGVCCEFHASDEDMRRDYERRIQECK